MREYIAYFRSRIIHLYADAKTFSIFCIIDRMLPCPCPDRKRDLNKEKSGSYLMAGTGEKKISIVPQYFSHRYSNRGVKVYIPVRQKRL